MTPVILGNACGLGHVTPNPSSAIKCVRSSCIAPPCVTIRTCDCLSLGSAGPLSSFFSSCCDKAVDAEVRLLFVAAAYASLTGLRIAAAAAAGTPAPAEMDFRPVVTDLSASLIDGVLR